MGISSCGDSGSLGSSSAQNESETDVESAQIVVESSENEEHSVDGKDESTTTLSDEFTAELLAEHPFDCLNQELDVFVNVFGIYVISHSSIPENTSSIPPMLLPNSWTMTMTVSSMIPKFTAS